MVPQEILWIEIYNWSKLIIKSTALSMKHQWGVFRERLKGDRPWMKLYSNLGKFYIARMVWQAQEEQG